MQEEKCHFVRCGDFHKSHTTNESCVFEMIPDLHMIICDPSNEVTPQKVLPQRTSQAPLLQSVSIACLKKLTMYYSMHITLTVLQVTWAEHARSLRHTCDLRAPIDLSREYSFFENISVQLLSPHVNTHIQFTSTVAFSALRLTGRHHATKKNIWMLQFSRTRFDFISYFIEHIWTDHSSVCQLSCCHSFQFEDNECVSHQDVEDHLKRWNEVRISGSFAKCSCQFVLSQGSSGSFKRFLSLFGINEIPISCRDCFCISINAVFVSWYTGLFDEGGVCLSSSISRG